MWSSAGRGLGARYGAPAAAGDAGAGGIAATLGATHVGAPPRGARLTRHAREGLLRYTSTRS